MRESFFPGLGIVSTLAYGAAIAWLYATAPRSLGEVATGARVAAGTYQVDAARFDAGLRLFRAEQFRAARDEWGRADPARRDPRTQFYMAYAFYREDGAACTRTTRSTGRASRPSTGPSP
jgi:hypothetical protein